MLMDFANTEAIRQIAYRIWEDEDYPEGCALEHWLRAQVIWQKDQIILIAHHIWEREKRPQGRELQHWLMAEVFVLVNLDRASRNIKPLKWDDKLGRIAREHTEEMARRGELFHSHIDKLYAENCWRGSGYWNASIIVNSWVESDKHRTWLLCPNLKHIGVGIAVSDSGMYASWTFWRSETKDSDWWYIHGSSPPGWWY